MQTYYYFRAGRDPNVFGFTDDPSGAKLPADQAPWSFVGELAAAGLWQHPADRRVVHAGVTENGFFLWEPAHNPVSDKLLVESDRVEGTAVFDPAGKQIGTVKRLLIDKRSGHVGYVDIEFGGFLGIGTDHFPIPWEQLSYDTQLGGYRTPVTADDLRGAPPFYEADRAIPDREREVVVAEYWTRIGGW